MNNQLTGGEARIVFVAGGVNVPASRFRVDAVTAGLRNQGLDCRIIYGYGRLDSLIRIRFLQRVYRLACRLFRALRTVFVRNADVVLVQRLALPFCSLPERILAWRGIPVIFDFDDAVDLNARLRPSRHRDHALHKMFQASTMVIAGNCWLARKSSHLVPTRVIPTCLDLTRYRAKSSVRCMESPPVIGWMGTSSNYDHLRIVEGAIRKLRESRHIFETRIISEMKDHSCIEALHADFSWWAADSEVEMLQSFDIGIMPLIDNEWARGKCSFKVIQYMAMGLPVVASDIGFNRDVVDHGRTGFLVRSNSEWVDALGRLIESPELRESMGRAGRARAEEKFSLGHAVCEYRNCIEKVLQCRVV